MMGLDVVDVILIVLAFIVGVPILFFILRLLLVGGIIGLIRWMERKQSRRK